MTEVDGFFRQITSQASQLLTRLGFEELDKNGGDRHGSWESVWIHRKGKRQSSIGISLSILENDEYSIEMWVGVSENERFGKRYVWACEPIGESALNFLTRELEMRVTMANRIAEDWPNSELPFFYKKTVKPHRLRRKRYLFHKQ